MDDLSTRYLLSAATLLAAAALRAVRRGWLARRAGAEWVTTTGGR